MVRFIIIPTLLSRSLNVRVASPSSRILVTRSFQPCPGALEAVDVDYCVPAREIPALLTTLVNSSAPERGQKGVFR